MSDRVASSGGLFTAKRHSTTYDFISPLRLDLGGKHVLITGAGWESGVGFATAKAFACAGASVIVVADLRGVAFELVEQLKSVAIKSGRAVPSVIACTVDIAKPESVQNMYYSLVHVLKGRLDILINNAAHMEPLQLFLDSDPEVYWRTWQVNVRGLINMARAFLPIQLTTQASGGELCTMINVSSSGALSVRPKSSSYRTSKLSVLRWTESIHTEYADQGLLAYCVNPGAIKTEITRTAPDNVRNSFPDTTTMAGDTIAWLASTKRNWLGGRYVSCPWDMEELMEKKHDILAGDKLKMRLVL